MRLILLCTLKPFFGGIDRLQTWRNRAHSSPVKEQAHEIPGEVWSPASDENQQVSERQHEG
jgi:hypothetical protein